MRSLILKWIAALTILMQCGGGYGATAPRGFVLYTDPPNTYVETLEFVSITTTSIAFATAVLPTGPKQEISRGGIIAIINYPPAMPTESLPQEATTALRSIQTLRPKYPQFAAKLNAAETRWNNSLNAFRQAQQRSPQVTPTKPNTLPFMEIDGIKYTEAALSSVDEESVAIATATGLTRLPIEKLSAAQVAALNSTSKTIAILDRTAIIRQAQDLSKNPEAFATFLTKYPKRFPLTSLSFHLRAKNWAQAASIASSGMSGRIRGHNGADPGTDSTVFWVAAAQAQSGDLTGAFAFSNSLKSVTERAGAHRIVAQWCVNRGNFELAEAACTAIAQDLRKLPETELNKLESSSSAALLSPEALEAVFQQITANGFLVKGLTAAGRLNGVSVWVQDIRDTGAAARAWGSILEASIVAHDPKAESLSTALTGGQIRTPGKEGYLLDILNAKARAYARLKNWDAAIDVLNQEMVPADAVFSQMGVNFKIGIMAQKAKIYRSSGDENASRQMIAEALKAAADTRDCGQALKLLDLDAKQTWDCIDRIRNAVVQECVTKDEISDLLILSAILRHAHETQRAGEALKAAQSILAQTKKSADMRSGSGERLAEELAHMGDFDAARQMLNSIARPEDQLLLREILSIEQARQGELEQAVRTLEGEALTDANLDALGAAVIGAFDKIEPFPMLNSD